MESFSLYLEASMKHWDEYMSFVDTFTGIESLSPKKSYRLKLAVEELLSNIVRSSEASCKLTNHLSSLEISFSINTTLNPHILEVILTDNAPHFDPEFDKQDSPDHIDHPVSCKPIGGLGLFLVKESVDSVSYKYSNAQNTYTLKVELSNTSD